MTPKKGKKRKKINIKVSLRNILKTFQIYWEIDRKNFILLFIAIVLLSVIPLVISYLFGRTTNLIVSYLGGNDVDTKEVLTFFLITSALGIFQGTLYKLGDYIERVSYFTWHEKMTVAFLDKISTLDYEKYESPKFNNFINKVKQGYAFKPGEYAHVLMWTFFSLLQMISSLFVLAAFAPILLVIILLSLIPSFIIQKKSSKLGWGIWNSKGDTHRLFYHTAYYLDDSTNIKEVRIFGIRSYLLDLVKRLLGDFQNEQKKILNKTQKWLYLSSLLESLVLTGIEIWLLLKVLARTVGFGLGDFTFYRGVVGSFTSSSRLLVSRMARLYEYNLYMTDFFKLLDIENKIVSKPDAIKIETDKVPVIEFRNVSFKYPKTEKYIYKNFSIKINPGEDIALVGENGAGKTTFVKLLLRFYDVEEGAILINGINIKDLDLKSWYRNLGVLFQDFNRYSYSVKENVFLGKIEDKDNFEKVKEVVKQAGAEEFVEEYKKKYDQMLDKSFKNGIEPSGGQWQRIALARAFFRDANILVLDEPTSAIDAKGEYEIFKKIAQAQEKKTTIIISHRFSTVKKADKIYVIDDGKITEQGTHIDLMQIEKGKYKEMFELQAEGYK